jgi:hypothetical protein
MLNEDPTPVQVQRANLWTPKYKYKTKKEKNCPFFALLPRLYKAVQWRFGLAFNSKSRTPKQKLFVIFFYLQDYIKSIPFQQIKHNFFKLIWQSL